MEGSQPQDEPQGATNLNSFEPAGKNQLQQTPIQCKVRWSNQILSLFPLCPNSSNGKAFCKSKLGLFWRTGWLGWVILTPALVFASAQGQKCR